MTDSAYRILEYGIDYQRCHVTCAEATLKKSLFPVQRGGHNAIKKKKIEVGGRGGGGGE